MDKNAEYENNRFFLKDLVRQQIDFSQTDQNRGIAPPPMQKIAAADAHILELPDGRKALSELAVMSVGDAIINRSSIRRYSSEALTVKELSALLWATQGVRGIANYASAFRSVPSAGARHSFETYLAISNVDGVPPGLYRYLPFEEKLEQIAVDSGIGIKSATVSLGQRFIASASVVFFWSVIPSRMEWRYGQAAHKVIAIDAGHVCQNLYLACTSLGMGTCAIAAYDQRACDTMLELDGEEEFTIYLAPVGKLRK